MSKPRSQGESCRLRGGKGGKWRAGGGCKGKGDVIEGQERKETSHTHTHTWNREREVQGEIVMFGEGGREVERGCAENKRPHTI